MSEAPASIVKISPTGEPISVSRPEGFSGNYSSGDATLILARVLTEKGVEGIEISDAAVDDRGKFLEEKRALIISPSATNIFDTILTETPEMRALIKATDVGRHGSGERHGRDSRIPQGDH